MHPLTGALIQAIRVPIHLSPLGLNFFFKEETVTLQNRDCSDAPASLGSLEPPELEEPSEGTWP